MLEIIVPASESVDEETSRVITQGFRLELEHSLVSLSKWEAHFEKPFLSPTEKTEEETRFYIKDCMVMSKNPPEDFFDKLSQENFNKIQDYINGKHTATWFNDRDNRPGGSRQVITAAVIYSWLVALKIPFEVEHWHLNELFTLVRVCNEQHKTPKRMTRAQQADAARQRAALNAQRQAQMKAGG